MSQVHKFDSESQAVDCRVIIPLEDETDTIERAWNHVRESHGRDFSDDEHREKYLEVV